MPPIRSYRGQFSQPLVKQTVHVGSVCVYCRTQHTNWKSVGLSVCVCEEHLHISRDSNDFLVHRGECGGSVQRQCLSLTAFSPRPQKIDRKSGAKPHRGPASQLAGAANRAHTARSIALTRHTPMPSPVEGKEREREGKVAVLLLTSSSRARSTTNARTL